MGGRESAIRNSSCLKLESSGLPSRFGEVFSVSGVQSDLEDQHGTDLQSHWDGEIGSLLKKKSVEWLTWPGSPPSGVLADFVPEELLHHSYRRPSSREFSCGGAYVDFKAEAQLFVGIDRLEEANNHKQWFPHPFDSSGICVIKGLNLWEFMVFSRVTQMECRTEVSGGGAWALIRRPRLCLTLPDVPVRWLRRRCLFFIYSVAIVARVHLHALKGEATLMNLVEVEVVVEELLLLLLLLVLQLWWWWLVEANEHWVEISSVSAVCLSIWPQTVCHSRIRSPKMSSLARYSYDIRVLQGREPLHLYAQVEGDWRDQ
ncbi:hypothetical protein Tco_0947174 [Tanacetum coccineum]